MDIERKALRKAMDYCDDVNFVFGFAVRHEVVDAIRYWDLEHDVGHDTLLERLGYVHDIVIILNLLAEIHAEEKIYDSAGFVIFKKNAQLLRVTIDGQENRKYLCVNICDYKRFRRQLKRPQWQAHYLLLPFVCVFAWGMAAGVWIKRCAL